MKGYTSIDDLMGSHPAAARTRTLGSIPPVTILNISDAEAARMEAGIRARNAEQARREAAYPTEQDKREAVKGYAYLVGGLFALWLLKGNRRGGRR